MSSPSKGCRPPGAKGPKGIAKSKATRWRIIALIAVHLLFAIHLAMWMDGRKTISPVEPSEAMEFSKRSVINAGFIFFAITILSTLVLGRFFCGWACHVVALQDLCAGMLKRVGITPKPLRSRWLALVPFVAAFYMFLWPFWQRMQHAGIDTPITLELETTAFWATFPGLVITILTFLFAGFAAVYFLGSKGFCTYACPYGAFFNVADRFAPLSIRVNDQCEGCGHCTAVCTSNVAVAVEVRKYGMVVDSGCMKCMDCVSVCPKDALSLSWGKPAIAIRNKEKRKPRFSMGYEALLSICFVAAFFTFRGLYGRVPFLMSLAMAGCLAFLVLRTVELARKPMVRIAPFSLKTNGAITGAGKTFLGLMLLVLAFWGHSAWIRYADWQSKLAYAPLIAVRDGWFTDARAEVTAEVRATAETVVKRATKVIEQGIWETPRVRVERGWAHMILGQEEAFFEDLSVAAPLAVNDVNTLVERGHALRLSGKSAEAIPLYREGARRDPDQMISAQYLIDACREAGRMEDAISYLRSQTEARPWDPLSLEMLARALAFDGQDKPAEEALEKAVDLSEPGQGPWSQLMAQYWRNGQKNRAEELLRRVLKGDPNQVGASVGLVNILFELGRTEEAEKALKEALSRDPQNETLLNLQQRVQPK